jgi:tetratricopeptide (TPR) repeat protein
MLAGPHSQPSADEQRLFAEGTKAFEAGDARAAERAWKEGYAVAHDPAFLVRIGEAEEKAGAPAEAVESYRRYLREAPDASDRADIEQRIARLAPGPAPAGPGDRTEAPHEFGSGPAPTLPTAPAPRSAGAVDTESGQPVADEEDSGWNAINITAWSATAATALLLGTAAFFGAQASSKESDANRLLTFRDMNGVPLTYTPETARKYEEAISDGKNDDHYAKIALLGAAGTAAVAAVLFVIDGVRPARSQVAIVPAPGAAGALTTWAWRF